MISLKQVEEQLKCANCNFRVWGRTEIRELANILMPEETILQCVNGMYEGGFALLCVTQYRVLLVDRKPFLLTIEDVRYDMIAEVDYNNRLMNATLRVLTPMRNLSFSSWSMSRLRQCAGYIQQRLMEVRQQHVMQPQPAAQQTPLPAAAAPMAAAVERQPEPVQASDRRKGIFSSISRTPMNPYTKVPMLARRRRFPSYY